MRASRGRNLPRAQCTGSITRSAPRARRPTGPHARSRRVRPDARRSCSRSRTDGSRPDAMAARLERSRRRLDQPAQHRALDRARRDLTSASRGPLIRRAPAQSRVEPIGARVGRDAAPTGQRPFFLRCINDLGCSARRQWVGLTSFEICHRDSSSSELLHVAWLKPSAPRPVTALSFLFPGSFPLPRSHAPGASGRRSIPTERIRR